MSELKPLSDIDALWDQLRTFGRERYAGFESLMKYQVQDILLVASLYDSFTLEEGGRLTELILTEYRDLNLGQAPVVTRSTSGEDALEQLRSRNFDLIITLIRIGELDVVEFARQAKAAQPGIPVVALGYSLRELEQVLEIPDSPIDRFFVWTGEVMLLVAIIKYIEDLRNVEEDTRNSDVRTIILIEDSVRFYSAYLPLIYTELVRQTADLLTEGINLSQKLMRLRARPKILFATTFEEAWEYYDRYRSFMLGAICDARFHWKGEKRDKAGLEFIRRMKEDDPQMPAVLQSSDLENEPLAGAIGASFIHKDSHSLLTDLRRFMRSNFGFGDFVFCLPDGREVGRASDMRAFIREMERVPDESLMFHAAHDHFSNWLRARTMFTLARMIKSIKTTQFGSVVALRRSLMKTVLQYHEESLSGHVADFSNKNFDRRSEFTRIGLGSMGGKARGLAFMNHILSSYQIQDRFPGTVVKVPSSAVVATDVFDAFLDQGELRDLAITETHDDNIVEAFLTAKLPGEILGNLRHFLDQVRYPLAVRSSSILEDTHAQSFAGVYDTYMIPNNHQDLAVRLDQLCDAIKLVYASTFFQSAKAYLKATSNRVEEEKMAVVVQQMVGRKYDRYVYPGFAGVVQSTDHYATGEMHPEDGVALVALGLGKTVIEGGRCLRFSPRAPTRLMQFATVEDTLENSQRRFLALDVSDPEVYPVAHEDGKLVWLELKEAEGHGTLQPVGSVYSPENDAVYDGINRKGTRLVTFAHVLKSGVFPLAEILTFLMDLGRRCMSCPIEIEFAVICHEGDRADEFCLLQIRPLAADREVQSLNPALFRAPDALVATEVALGNGRYRGIRDVVYTPPDRFSRGRTREIAREVGELNRKLLAENRPFLLIGPGRWGSADRWLGVPVQWADISGASVIVESDLDDFKVTPSQGTHFFQNLISFQVGYLTVNQTSGGGRLDWKWLDAQPPVAETKLLRHIRLEKSLGVFIDGLTGRGLVLKPGGLDAR